MAPITLVCPHILGPCLDRKAPRQIGGQTSGPLRRDHDVINGLLDCCLASPEASSDTQIETTPGKDDEENWRLAFWAYSRLAR